MRQLAFLLFVIGHAGLLQAATCTSSTSGNWNSQATWGGAGGGCGAGGPVAGDTVIVNNANTVTLTAAASAATVTITPKTSGGASTSTLSINGQTLTLTGNLAIDEGSNANRKSLLSVGAGTVTVGGNITRAASTANTAGITFSSGLLSVAGSLATGYSPFTAGTGAVNFNGAAAQTVPTYTYSTIKVNNTAGATLAAATSATNLTIGDVTAGSLFSDGGFQLTATGTLTLTSGTLSLGSATAATTFPGFATNTISAGTTVTYASGVAQAVSTTPSYSNLTFSGAGTKTTASGTLTIGATWTAGSATALQTSNTVVSLTGDLAGAGSITQGTGAMTVGGNWSNTGTFTANAGAGVTLTGPAKQITGPAGGITFTTLSVNGTYTNLNAGTVSVSTALSGSGTLTQGANSALNLGGTSGITGLNASTNTPNTVTYNGGSAQTIKAVTYYNLALNNASGATLGGATTVNNNLTLTSGTLDTSASNFSLSVTGSITGAGGLTANASAIGVGGDMTVTTFTAGTSTVTFNGAGAQAVGGGGAYTFNNLTVNKSAGTATLGGATTVNATLTITAGTLDVSASNFALNVKGDFSNSATFTARAGTVTLNGTAAQAIGGSSNTAFSSVTISNVNAAVSASTSFSVTGTLTMNASTVLTPAAAVVVSGAGTLTGSGTVQVTRTAATPDFSSQYSITTKTLTNLTVEYIGSGAQIVSALSYGSLKDSNTAAVLTTAGNFNVSGTLTMAASTILQPSSGHVINNALAAGTLTGSGTVQVTRAAGSSDFASQYKFSTYTLSGLTVEYTSAGDEISPTTAVGTYGNVKVSNASGAVTASANFDVSATLTMSGGVLLPASGVVINSAAPAGTITGSGTVKVTRTANSSDFANQYKFSTTTLTSLTVDYAGTSAVTAQDVSPLGYGNLVISNTANVVNAAASFSVSSTLTVNASATLVPAAGAVVSGGGTLTGNGTVRVTRIAVTPDFLSQYTIASTLINLTVEYIGAAAQTVSALAYGTLKINNASGATLGGATSAGTLTITSGALDTSASNFSLSVTGSITGVGGLTANASAIGVGGDMTVTTFTAGTSTVTFNGAGAQAVGGGGAYTFNNLTVNKSAGTATLGGATTANGTLTIAAGTLDVSASNFALNVKGDFSNSATFTARAGTVTLNGTAAQAIGGSSTTSFSSLTISNTSAAVSPSVNFNVSGTLNMNGGATLLNPSSGVVINNAGAAGTLSGSGTVKVTRAAASSDFANQYKFTTYSMTAGPLTVDYAGAGAQEISPQTGASKYGNLTVSNTAAAVTASANFDVGTTLNMNGASTSLIPVNTVVVNSAAAAGTIIGTGTVKVTRTAATPDYSSQYKFSTNTLTNLTVEYVGTAAQTLSAITYGGLKINNSSGVTLSAGDATITGALTLTSGIVAAGANNVIINAGGSVSRPGGSPGHVNGNLRKNVATGAGIVRTFEVGDASTYAPVTITFGNVSATGNLTAKTVAGEHPDVANSGINGSDDVNRYWVVTNSGVTFDSYSAAITYAAADNDSPTTVFADYVIGKADGCNGSLQSCTWTYPTLNAAATSTGAQANAMTAFSGFAAGNNVASFSITTIGQQTQGSSFTVNITAQNSSGSQATNFTGTVDVSCIGCTLSGGNFTTGSFTNGQLTNLSLTVTNTGSNFQVKVTRTGGTATGTSNTFTVVPSVASFNVVDTGANAVTGKIFTKISALNFTLDIVALDASNAVSTGFTGTVAVDLVDATTYNGSNCATLPAIAALANQTFISTDNGRKAFTTAEANAWRNARVRIKYPTASPTITSCSGDNFAIRPASLSLSVTHDNRTTADSGSGTAFNNKATSNGTVHNAGRPFTISSTATNSASATTTNYDGSPSAVLSACTGGDACVAPGSAPSLGSFVSGVMLTNTATYNAVGAFTLTLQDATFATVDLADGTPAAQYTLTSGSIDVGRFVPDHFDVAFNAPQFATACTTGAAPFTYIAQSFHYVTAPVLTVTAKTFGGGTITNYTGSPLWRLNTGSIGGYSAFAGTLATTPPTTPTSVSESNGVTTLTFGDPSSTASFTRSTPVVPFDADISLGVTVSDADNAVYESPVGTNANPARFGQPTAGNGIPFSNGKTMRFGRLRLSSAVGPVSLPLQLPIRTEYWTASGWTTNVDDGCSSFAIGNFSLGSFQKNLAVGETSIASVTYPLSANTGTGAVVLARPSGGDGKYDGSVLVTGNIGAAGLTYLQGAWDGGGSWTIDPSARAAFGAYGAQPKSFIFQRENY